MKKKITITLNKDHQIYDILNKTYLVGRSREGMDGYTPELISSIKASTDSNELNELKRSCMFAVATLKSCLSKYITSDKLQSDNKLNFGEVTFELQMPSNFDTAVTDVIAQLCHQYVANMACANWYRLTSPKEAETYEAAYQSTYLELKQAISKRKRPEALHVKPENT